MKTTYQIDPSHSTAAFSVKHMMIAKVHGAFEKMQGTFQYDSNDISQSSVVARIDASSINTRQPDRDVHLKSADFFDVEKFPEITFTSTRFEKTGDELVILGDLTIHGVTKPIQLEMELPSVEQKDPWGNIKIGISGKTKIKRKDFGLTWNAALEAGGVLVGDDISITLDVQLTREK